MKSDFSLMLMILEHTQMEAHYHILIPCQFVCCLIHFIHLMLKATEQHASAVNVLIILRITKQRFRVSPERVGILNFL